MTRPDHRAVQGDKVMKLVIRGAVCLIISWAVVWLMSSFVHWELDPSEWDTFARFMCAFLATGFGLIALIASVE